ncbi:TPA: excisionase [Serratia fonticola]
MPNLECIPISTYCQMTGETSEAINKRLQRNIWREGVQVLKLDGVKERWIDLAEVNNWARQRKSSSHAG